jgi:hypothetical protein
MSWSKTILLASISLLVILISTAVQSNAQKTLPNPVLYFAGSEGYTANGKDRTRYKLAVDNFEAYPNTLFAPAPALPPCGANTKSSRSWVDIYDSTGKRLYGFCALGKASDLNTIWFSLERDEVPPSWVYIEINDRETNTKYKSNLAETVE